LPPVEALLSPELEVNFLLYLCNCHPDTFKSALRLAEVEELVHDERDCLVAGVGSRPRGGGVEEESRLPSSR